MSDDDKPQPEQSSGINISQSPDAKVEVSGIVAGRDVIVHTADERMNVRGLASPYRGLQAFTYAERKLYAGREHEVVQALSLLTAPGAARTLLFVTGASGSGKSSFAQAGLVPALEAHYAQRSYSIRHAVMRPGLQPLASLADALAQLGIPAEGPFALLQPFSNGVQQRAKPADVSVIVLDQFEELFSPQCYAAQRDQLFALLTTLPPFAQLHIHVIATMRADFLPELFQHPGLYDLAKQGIDLRAMRPAALSEAIQRPLQQRYPQKRFEPALVEKLANDAAGDAAYLPLLQVTLDDIWRRGSLTLAAYGSLIDAVGQRADDVMDYVDYDGACTQPRPLEDQEVILALFLDLVDVSLDADVRRDVRRRRSLAALLGAGQRDAQRQRLIADLCNARLLSATSVVDDGRDVEVIDIIHESLITHWDRLQQAVTERRLLLQQRVRFEQALQEWEAHARADSYLLIGVRLAEAEALAQQDSIALRSIAAQELLRRSFVAREAERRRELAQAQTLAEEQRLRAEEQQKRAEAEQRRAEEQQVAAQRLRRRAQYLAGALLVALVAVVVAVIGFAQANERAVSEALARVQAQREGLASAAQSALGRGELDQAAALVLAAIDKVPGSIPIEAIPPVYGIVDQGTRRRITGHSSTVWSVAFSPDGKTIASGSGDRTLRLWDVATGQVLHTFTGHTGPVWSVAFSPDGKTIASGSGDRTLRLWDVATGQVLHTFTGHTDGVSAVAFGPDGKTILSGSGDTRLRLWDVATGQTLRIFTGHKAELYSVAFSPDGKNVLSGSGDTTLRLWEVATGKALRTFTGHTKVVLSSVFSPDGSTILSGSDDGMLRLWDVATGKPLQTFIGHSSSVYSVAFSPDGTMVLSGSGDTTLRLWDVATGRAVRTFTGHTNLVMSTVFSPDGKAILSGSADNTLRWWDVTTTQPLQTLTGHTSSVYSVTFSPDGTMALSGSLDGTLRLWDVTTGRTLRIFSGHTAEVNSVAFSPNGTRALSGSTDGTLRLWNVATGQVLHIFTGHRGVVDSVAFSPDGTLVLSGSVDGTLRLWNVATGQVLHIFTGHSYPAYSVTFSPDGTMALSGSEDQTLRLWDVSTGKTLRTFIGHTARVHSVVFSPDGKTALSGADDNTLRLWDVETSQTLRIFSGHSTGAYSVAFSPDGKMALSGADDNTLRLWDVSTGQELRTFYGHTAAVRSVAFSPDGKTALSGSGDGSLRLWRTDTVADLVAFIRANRYVPELPCAQRALYDVPPLCSETQPTATAQP